MGNGPLNSDDAEMGSLPLGRFVWADPDRRELYRALSFLTSSTATKGRVEVCLHTLLVHLEIYDDPRQGVGHWVWADEISLVDELGEKLQNLVADATQGGWGAHALGHPAWDDARSCATTLKRMIEANGARPTPA